MKPFALTSMPKSGTHLIRNFFEKINYTDKYELNMNTEEYSMYRIRNKQHCSFKDLYGNSTSTELTEAYRSFQPFTQVPIIFLWRDPVDILISEKFYYRQTQTMHQTPFKRLKGSLIYDRLIKVDYGYLEGDLIKRLRNYIGFFDLENVIPFNFKFAEKPEYLLKFITTIKRVLKLQPSIEELEHTYLLSLMDDNPTKTKVRSKQIIIKKLLLKKYPELATTKEEFWAQDNGDGTIYDRKFRITPMNPHPILIKQGIKGNNIMYYLGRYYIINQSQSNIKLEQGFDSYLEAMIIAHQL